MTSAQPVDRLLTVVQVAEMLATTERFPLQADRRAAYPVRAAWPPRPHP